MDEIKEAFSRVKEDINFLKQEINFLNQNLYEIQKQLFEMNSFMENSFEKIDENKKKLEDLSSTYKTSFKTVPTDIPTHDLALEGLKGQNLGISIGNQGVPTDKQTNRQTNQHIDKSSYNYEIPPPQKKNISSDNSIEDAIEILDSLDNLKKEIRLKFKRLTDQEMLVFTTLYQLSEENGFSDYKEISIKLGLTESSIRDYIGRLIKKGIPVEKIKVNNKNIQLNISKNLKKIATLHTILQLRGL